MTKGPGTDVPTCACGEYLDLEIVNGEPMCEDCREAAKHH